MSKSPLISVIMPVYNGEKYISAAIQSILAQTFSDFELIILNDGSTDRTIEIVSSFHDSRVKVIDNSSNKGIIHSRNHAIHSSKGMYLANLDSDDIALPERFAKQLIFFEKNKEYSVVGSDVQLIDEHAKIIGEIKYSSFNRYIKENLFFYNCFAQSSTMIQKKHLDQLNEIYRNQHPLAEDYDLWVRMVEHNPMTNIQETLTQYRTSSSGISRIKNDDIQLSVKKIHEHLFEKLGIAPNDALVEIHEKLLKMELNCSGSVMWGTYEWIQRIITSNIITQRYNKIFFHDSLKRIFISNFLKDKKKTLVLAEIILSDLELRQKMLLIKYLF